MGIFSQAAWQVSTIRGTEIVLATVSAISIRSNMNVAEINVNDVQRTLLSRGARIH